jgi:hypothetical protein
LLQLLLLQLDLPLLLLLLCLAHFILEAELGELVGKPLMLPRGRPGLPAAAQWPAVLHGFLQSWQGLLQVLG